jgi:hypothetical protein
MAIRDFENFEQQLQSNLNPVRPNPEFVSHLRYRLVTPEHVVIESHRQAPLQLLLSIVAIGLFSGAFLYWLFRRLS